MFRIFRQFHPAFLKRIDHKLLIEKPMIWATRIHIVAFWSAVFFAFLALKAIVTPVNLTNLPDPEIHFGLLLIPTAIFLLTWGARVYQLKPDKAFGLRKPFDGVKEQMIYLVGLMMMLAGPVAYSTILNQRIDAQIEDDTFIQDVMTIHEGYSLNPHFYPSVYLYNIERWKGAAHLEALRGNRENQQTYSLSAAAHNHIFSRYSEIDFLPGKYMTDTDINGYTQQELHLDHAQLAAFEKHKKQVRSNIEIIKKIKTNFSVLTNPRAILSLSAVFLFVVLAFSVFQQASWQQFLLALGSAVIGGIVIGIGSELLDGTFRYSREEDWAMLLGAGLYFALLTQIFGKRNSRRMAAWRGVAISLVSMATPILLVCFFGWIDFLDPGEDKGMLFPLMIVADISFLLWHGVFRHRMSNVQASPTLN